MLVIASGNRHKIREMEAMLAPLELDVAPQPEGLEVEETGSTFAENARLKAETVARLTGRWALADDSGLAVDVLGGAPGVYSARYAQGDEQRMARLLGEMGETPYRSAALITALAVADPSGSTILEAEGICRGRSCASLWPPRAMATTGCCTCVKRAAPSLRCPPSAGEARQPRQGPARSGG